MRYFICIWVLLLASLASLHGQRDKVLNLPEFDERYLHFGFSLGINSANYEMKYDYIRVDSLLGVEVIPQMGFNINMISELHFWRYFGLRFTPGISFAQRNIEYRNLNDDGRINALIKPVEATYLEFPLIIKMRSARLNNYAMYVLGGGQYNLDLAAGEDVDNSQNIGDEIIIKTKKHNYGAVVGAGADFFMDFYKFSLEVKYNVGLNNIFIPDNTIYAAPIDRIKPRMLIFSISFEG